MFTKEHFLFFPTLSTLLDHLLTLGVNLLVVDVPRGLALLALRLFGLDTDGGSTAGANLLLCFLPRRRAMINCVSED